MKRKYVALVLTLFLLPILAACSPQSTGETEAASMACSASPSGVRAPVWRRRLARASQGHSLQAWGGSGRRGDH